jgi:hypothetical protein
MTVAGLRDRWNGKVSFGVRRSIVRHSVGSIGAKSLAICELLGRVFFLLLFDAHLRIGASLKFSLKYGSEGKTLKSYRPMLTFIP